MLIKPINTDFILSENIDEVDEKAQELVEYCKSMDIRETNYVSPYDENYQEGEEFIWGSAPISPYNAVEVTKGYYVPLDVATFYKKIEKETVEAVMLNMVFHSAFPAINLHANHQILSQELLQTNYMNWEMINRIQFPKPEYLIDKILPAVGVSMLGGAPKDGKSMLSVLMGRSIALGVPFLGRYNSKKSQVLAFFLEDPVARVNSRLKLYGEAVTPNLIIGSGIEQNVMLKLESAMDKMPEIKLIILDTLARLPGMSEQNSYKEEYTFLSNIQRFALKKQIHILIVHHTKKSESSSMSGSFYGSQGITGAVDNLLVLTRKGSAGTLEIQGREPLESSVPLIMDAKRGWQLNEMDSKNMTPEQMQIYELLLTNGPMKSGDIAKTLNKKGPTISHLLNKMKKGGFVENGTAFGTYALVSA